MFILSLGAVRAGDLTLVGRKAANLGELAVGGFPVPPAFVVTTSAFRQVFDSLGLQDEIDHIDETSAEQLLNACTRIQQRIVSTPIANSMADEILEAYALLVGVEQICSVVRSSATVEDLAHASFAGQHRTYYCNGPAHLLELIRNCWGSLWSVEAAVYRATLGISHRTLSMAVIVQQMIRSDVSGIAFTADPVTGDAEGIVIESSWGMGAAIADGRVTPDRYLVRRPTLEIRERRIAEKRMMVCADLDSADRLAEVPRDMRHVETLASKQIEAVAALALRCEELFRSPQDIEWAFANGELHLLQSRPITTLRRQEIVPPAGKWVLFKPFVENFTGPLTPLQIDLMSRAFSPLIRAVGGRFYISMSLIRLLLPISLSDEAIANLLYLTSDGVPVHAPFQFLKLPFTVLAAAIMWLISSVLLARSRDMPDDFMDGYRVLCREVENDHHIGPAGALHRLLTNGRVGDPVGWMAVSVNCGAAVRSSFWVGVVKALLQRWAPELGSDAVAILCSGAEGVLSLEMGRDLAALADLARDEPEVATLIVSASPEEALQRLREHPATPAFLSRLAEFLSRYGHRTAKEFDVQTLRWEEDPSPVIAMVRNYLIEPSTGLSGIEKYASETREKLQDRLVQSLAWRWPVVRFAARRAREFLKVRENSRSFYIMGFGVVRKKILTVEKELLREGKLKCRGDIFFLLWWEVTALRSGSLKWLEVEERIQDRRMEHVRMAKLTPRRTFGVKTTSSTAASTVSNDVLHGQGASPGTYTGIARVILDPGADANLRPGEILVAPYADAAWAPLFLTAGAAVVEVGSYLSHAGTVAREYGVPFVVDVPDCTRRLRSGMRLLVDGDEGIVRIIEGELV